VVIGLCMVGVVDIVDGCIAIDVYDVAIDVDGCILVVLSTTVEVVGVVV